MERKPKWQSRKLWVAVGTLLAIVLTDVIGLQLDAEPLALAIANIAEAIIGSVYVTSEASIDRVK
ncbi:MAG: hypothetical protein H8D49_03810 [Dehalococcoidia bacterium]|nr:hypothetical protein [Dehalococcoidia bacterium]